MVAVLFISFLALVFLGMPIAFALGLGCIISIGFCMDTVTLSVFVQRMFGGINSFPLMCIAFFILAGDLMSRGNLTNRLVRFANVFVGRIPGGLAHVNVLASMFFGGISGSANADVSSLGPLEIAMMEDAGYDREFSVAITCASATIGVIIPPSIPFVLYAMSAGNISISDMFIAGIIPGILIGVSLMLTCYFFAIKRHYPRGAKQTLKQNLLDIVNGIAPCFLFIIILGGVLLGVFTPTESSVVAALYALILTVFVYRSISIKELPKIILGSAVSTATVLFLVGVSTSFSYILAYAKVPQMVAGFIMGVTSSKIIFYLLMFAVFIFIGMFMDMGCSIIILTPIFLPLAIEFGMDPIHFGMFMTTALSIGLYTPPVGSVLFIGCNVGKVPIEKGAKACLPFWLVTAVAVMLIALIPELTLWLPSVLS